MKQVSGLVVLLLMLSCSGKERNTSTGVNNFIEKTIDLAIECKGNTIELPFIYDSLSSQMPADSSEKLILVETLKSRGFKVITWGRGNYPPKGPGIVNLTLQKKNCICVVDKIYYATAVDTLFEMSERITCRDSVVAVN